MGADQVAVVVSACRTPIGAFRGALARLTGPQLGAVTIRAAIERARLRADQVDEVIMGEVLTAGVGQAPARQAALGAGLPDAIPCTTVNKVCGSGLKAVMLAVQAVRSGDADVIVAGGMESMSNAPYLLRGARDGYRFGHQEVTDSMIVDGLWDVYNEFHMGTAAERVATEHAISREAQDRYAEQSYRRAQEAQADGRFDDEIVPVQVAEGSPAFSTDEEPGRADFAKMGKLRPAFVEDGSITAANASSLNDGASACVVMTRDHAAHLGIEPLAAITAQASAALSPELFVIAPAKVIPPLLARADLTATDIDLFEVNEAFAVGNLVVERELGIDSEQSNVNGGAVALGHPIGASGARILTTLIYAMRQRSAARGVAAICIGGGEGCGVLLERTA